MSSEARKARRGRARVDVGGPIVHLLLAGTLLLAPPPAHADGVSPACPALVAETVDLDALRSALAAGATPDDTCPVSHQVRRRLSFMEVLLGAIIPPLGVLLVLDPGKETRVRHVPLLTLAVGQKSHQAVDLLLQAGADPLRIDAQGATPLRAAIHADLGTEEARWTHMLLGQRRLPVDSLCKDTRLLDGLLDNPTLRSRLESAGLAEGGRDCSGQTWLHRAAADGDSERVRGLLESGVVPIHAADERGRHPVYLAARRGRWTVVEVLLEAGAPVVGAGGSQGSLLHEAAESGSVDWVERLLTAGHPVDATGESGRTPLSEAVEGGRVEVAQVLLAAGADPQAGGGALMPVAVRSGRVEMVRLLLSAGVSPEARNGWGEDMLDVAYGRDDIAIGRVLMEAGARPRSRHPAHSSRERTALERALLDGKAEWVALLLPYAGPEERRDALFTMMVTESLDAAEVLLDAGADGSYALAWMAAFHHPERVAFLRERGVTYGPHALDIMVPDAPVEAVRAAIADGAHVQGSGSQWRDLPIEKALVGRNADLVGVLVEAGAVVPEALWLRALSDRDESWLPSLVGAGVPVPYVALERAVSRGATEQVRLLLPACVLDRRQVRKLRRVAWWSGVPTELMVMLKEQERALRRMDP